MVRPKPSGLGHETARHYARERGRGDSKVAGGRGAIKAVGGLARAWQDNVPGKPCNCAEMLARLLCNEMTSTGHVAEAKIGQVSRDLSGHGAVKLVEAGEER